MTLIENISNFSSLDSMKVVNLFFWLQTVDFTYQSFHSFYSILELVIELYSIVPKEFLVGLFES